MNRSKEQIKEIERTTREILMEQKDITETEFDFIYQLAISDFSFETGRHGDICGYVSESEGFNMDIASEVMSSLVEKDLIAVSKTISNWDNTGNWTTKVEYDTWVAVKKEKFPKSVVIPLGTMKISTAMYDLANTKGWA